MKRISMIWLGVAGASLIAMAAPAAAADDPKVAAEVIALARSQWAASVAGTEAQRMNETLADDYTEFNADYPTRVDGKAMNVAIAGLPQAGKTLYGDMQNAKVQVYGDTAVLTYNYAGVNRSSEGKIEPQTAKSTRVYVKMNGQWKLVHANFAPVRAGN